MNTENIHERGAIILLTVFMYLLYYKGWTVIYVIACVGIAILAASILPVLKAGVEKWTSL